MKLRTRLNLVVAGLTATFVIVLIAGEITTARDSVREEIEAANRAASQLLGRLAAIYSREGGPELLLQFLQQLGRVHANDITLRVGLGRGAVPLAATDLQGRSLGTGLVCAFVGTATRPSTYSRCPAG